MHARQVHLVHVISVVLLLIPKIDNSPMVFGVAITNVMQVPQLLDAVYLVELAVAKVVSTSLLILSTVDIVERHAILDKAVFLVVAWLLAAGMVVPLVLRASL